MKNLKSHTSLVALVLVLMSFTGPGDKKKIDKNDPVILTVNEEKVPLSEFRYIYDKNNSRNEDAYTEKSVKEYLELYINFKLKVMEAERLGLDTAQSFIQELEGYRKQLAKPYLTEKGVTEALMKEAYERKKTEVNASHILLKLGTEADPSDTLKVYNRLMEIRKEVLAGKDFGQAAMEYSEDPSAKSNKGNLGFFTSLQMIYPFESVAYKTRIGEVSMPVRTRFGYHILKVHETRKASGQVTIAHIMVEAPSGIAMEDSISARNKIGEIYTELQNGGDWDQLAKQFSDDKRSSQDGGKLKPFAVGQYNFPKEFENEAFKLDSPGDISGPFQTPFGWHIVKLIEKKGLPTFEEMEAELKKGVNRDSRSELNKIALIKRLKEEDHFKAYNSSVKKALAMSDSTLSAGTWKYDSENKKLKKTLFKIEDEKYTIRDFFDYVVKTQKPRKGASHNYLMTTMYDSYLEKELLAYEESHLNQKYDDYRLLVKEYRDGILLFQLMDEKVWSKAVKDTTGLNQFFKDREHNYKWDKRITTTIYDVINEETLDELKVLIANGASQKAILDSLNGENPLAVQVESGTYETGDLEVLDRIRWAEGEQVVDHEDRLYYVVVKEVLPARYKKLNESRGLVISDYQNHLEKQWIDTLREKYDISVNEDVVASLYKTK